MKITVRKSFWKTFLKIQNYKYLKIKYKAFCFGKLCKIVSNFIVKYFAIINIMRKLALLKIQNNILIKSIKKVIVVGAVKSLN